MNIFSIFLVVLNCLFLNGDFVFLETAWGIWCCEW